MNSSAKNSFISAFAEELRRAREYSGINLADVASRTWIVIEYLEALEGGRWEAVPRPYLRGYLSLYAQAVGMNVDKVLQGFDRLMSAPGEEQSATIDSASPLLRQPEHIGVTRAKIRAGWFTTLTQNRKTAYLVLTITVAVLGTGLYLSRRAQRPSVTTSPFLVSLLEYRQSTRGPVTHLNLISSDSASRTVSRREREAMVRARDSGSMVLPDGPNGFSILHFRPFDTIVITYDTLTYMKLYPALAAVVSAHGSDSLTPVSMTGDTALFMLTDQKSTRPNFARDEE